MTASARPAVARGAVRDRAAALQDLPIDALAVGAALFAVLELFVRADPASGVTFSIGPFTDEALNVVNARNLVVFGHWSMDRWNLYLVQLPFSALMAIVFRILGVGIVQARLVTIVCVSLTAAGLAWGLRPITGRLAALFAGVAFGTSTLILYYGRLAFLEDLVVLALTAGTLVALRPGSRTFRWGLVGGFFLAVAIGTKPLAACSVAGLLAALLLWGWRDGGTRRWLAGALVAIGAAGLLWVLAVGLPYRTTIAEAVAVWPQIHFPTSPHSLRIALEDGFRESDGVFGPMLGPLLIVAGVGATLTALLWRRLDDPRRRAFVVAAGWLVGGAGVVLVSSYRPSRYWVPVVPAFAIVAAVGLSAALEWLRGHPLVGGSATRRSVRTGASAIVVALAVAAAAIPGILTYAGWMQTRTEELPAAQGELAAAVPDGTRVAGSAPQALLLESRAVTIVTGQANPLDQYAIGVRWFLTDASAGAPDGVPPAIWARRTVTKCVSWRGADYCLAHVP